MCLMLTLLISLISTFAVAETDFLIALEEDIPGITEEISRTHAVLLGHTRAGNNEQAISAAQKMVDQFREAYDEESEFLSTPLSYLGLVRLANEDAPGAIDAFNRAIKLVEQSSGQFDFNLLLPLQGIALSYLSLENYETASDMLRRAQHITHREKGVYNAEQLEIIDKLILVEIKTGEYAEADREQLFYLKIHENTYGKDDPRILPALQQVAQHMARRGGGTVFSRYRIHPNNTQLARDAFFRKSVDLYKRAISITEDNYGESDLRLIEPLRGIAQARTWQRANRNSAEDSLTRVLQIVKGDPGSDIPDIVRATVDLADMYVISSDSRAKKTYRKAWDLIADKPDYEDLREELFGTPVRLYPDLMGVIRLSKRPDKAEDEIFAEVEYTVRADGRVRQITIVDANVANEERRALRSRFSYTRFRPRVVAGETVDTEHMVMRQLYEVVEY